jgi:hypothetical protein
MAQWDNPPATAFHGTDTAALSPLRPRHLARLTGFAVALSRCRPDSDFARGFYVTTNLVQAREWANSKVRQSRSGARHKSAAAAVVLAFST